MNYNKNLSKNDKNGSQLVSAYKAINISFSLDIKYSWSVEHYF